MASFKLHVSRSVAKFQDRIMDAKEYLAFELLFSRMLREPGGVGRKEMSYHGARRSLHYSYYVSEKLQTVFVLMAYQERAGEPRKDDLLEERQLLAAIHQAEGKNEDQA